MRRAPGGESALGGAVALFVLSGTIQYVGAAIAVGLFAVMAPAAVAWWRLAVAALVLLAWRRPWSRGLTARQWAGSALFGVLLGAMNMAFYGAIAHIPLGTAVTLEFLGPVAVAAVAARGTRARLAVALALAGVLLIGGFGVDLADPAQRVGTVLALAAGAAWAGYILLGRRIAAARSGVDSLAIGMAAGALAFAPFIGGEALGAFASHGLLLALVAVAVCSSLVPYSLEQVILSRVPAGVFALLTSLLPATSLVVGMVALRQFPSGAEVLALVVISVAVALTARAPRAPFAG